MQALVDAVHWLEEHAALSTALVAASIVMVIASVWGVHHFLVTIPPAYFTHEHVRLERWKDLHPALRWSLLVGKNLLGWLLIVMGLVMLFTPGQGVLSLLLGVCLVDLPGKRTLERKIIERPTVLRVVNAMRARAGRPPLYF